MALQRLLDDWKKLADNEFFAYFLEYINKRARETLVELSKESYLEQKLRYYQGVYKALSLVANEYPARIIKEITQEIDK